MEENVRGIRVVKSYVLEEHEISKFKKSSEDIYQDFVKAEKLIADAKIQADIIIKTSVEQAEKQAHLIISDAKYQSSGQVKQAEKLAEMREKKSIADTEKQYETAIKMIYEELLIN